MEANLGYIAPMPLHDVCTPPSQTVYYSYINWPKEFNLNNGIPVNKTLHGTKCPRNILWLDEYSKHLPKSLIIAGIRHPVLFFQSFWNMIMDFQTKDTNKPGKTPYDTMDYCGENNKKCNFECPNGALVCFAKTRLHLPLARIGKTLLDDKERELLAPDDKDGGHKLTNHHIKNPIFLYDTSQLNHDYMWDELAKTLKVPEIPHDIHEGSNEARSPSEDRINICDAEYDDFRSWIMPHAYNMSIWICEYLVPVAKNETRDDVIIANPDRFCEIVRKYGEDPCNRLVRMSNGTYILDQKLDSTISISKV